MIYEGIRTFYYGGYTVRLWINALGDYDQVALDCEKLFQQRLAEGKATTVEFADYIMNHDTLVDTIEVLNRFGNGDIIHRAWP